MRHTGLLVSVLILAGLPRAEPALAAPPAALIYVQTNDSLPGFRDDELAAFLASTMATANNGSWHFVPAQAGQSAPDRVEWSFIPGAEAAGTVRTYGFSRAMMERLVGSSRVYTIEARLYLHGQYEALASGQFREVFDPQNTELTQEVSVISRNLMATPAVIDSAAHPDPVPRRPSM